MGYVAERLLKVAFFRVSGFPPGQAVDLRAITTHAAWTKANLHNLDGLGDLSIAERLREAIARASQAVVAALPRETYGRNCPGEISRVNPILNPCGY